MMKTSVALFFFLALWGCASITAPSTDRLRVNASVPNAVVSLNGENRGPAPVTLELPRSRRSSVVVRAPGHRPAACSTAMAPNGGYIAADIALCVLLFPIGCISFIDAGGAWNELEASSCEVIMEPTH